MHELSESRFSLPCGMVILTYIGRPPNDDELALLDSWWEIIKRGLTYDAARQGEGGEDD